MSWTREAMQVKKLVDFRNECFDGFKDGGSLLRIVGRERPGSWHELLAHRKVVDDASHDKPVKDGKE